MIIYCALFAFYISIRIRKKALMKEGFVEKRHSHFLDNGKIGLVQKFGGVMFLFQKGLFVYLGFYVAFNTVQVISRRVVGRAEETST